MKRKAILATIERQRLDFLSLIATLNNCTDGEVRDVFYHIDDRNAVLKAMIDES
jgi:hypothetical protein